MFIVVVGTTFQKCGLTAGQQRSSLRVVSEMVSGYQAISCPFQCVVRSVLWCLVLPAFFLANVVIVFQTCGDNDRPE